MLHILEVALLTPIPICSPLRLDIDEFQETPLRSLAVKEDETAVIKCLLPRSNPPALPRYRIQGKWLLNSTGIYHESIS